MNDNPVKNTLLYDRDLLNTIQPYLNYKEIIAIIGPRQVGKTTLLQMIFEQLSQKFKCIYLTFEKRDDLEIFNKDIENFKTLFCNPYDIIFIDEVQYATDAGQKLKYLFDTTNKKFIITGSSTLELKEMGTYLVGRIITFFLRAFSFTEFLRVRDAQLFEVIKPGLNLIPDILSNKNVSSFADPIKSELLRKNVTVLFDEYIIYGGYPRVITVKTAEEKRLILSSIIDNYLLREIQSLLHLATENELLLLAKFLALQMGNLLSYNELANATGLRYRSIKKHLQILKNTFIVDLAYPYYRNRRTELVKNPKVYFLDNGIRNKIIENFSPADGRTDIGSLAENYVFNRLNQITHGGSPVRFWRTKSQAEVDFIIEKEGSVIPVEVKYSAAGKLNTGKSFHSFLEKYTPKKAIITTTDTFHLQKIGDASVYFIPLYYFG